MANRIKTRQIRIGDVRIGGGAPIAIQSMVKTETSDVKKTISQIKRLEDAGCEIVRVAVKNFENADAIKKIKKEIKIPLVCDIHFNYRLALKSIENGADKIRLNPGNIRKRDEIAQVIRAARNARIPIRIGVNSGSVFSKQQTANRKQEKNISLALVNKALRYIKLFEAMDFRDIIISLKASDVVTTVEAYRKISKRCGYPLHLGVTAAGPYDSGIVKNAIGIGALLLDGIGDTIRVSLTSDPVNEVITAKRILSSLGLRRFGPDIISCPTCGRCQVDLIDIVAKLDNAIRNTQYVIRKRPLTIAVMGCEVNGPGEARDADLGIAFGRGSGILFVNGKIVRRIKAKNAVKELLKEIGTYALD